MRRLALAAAGLTVVMLLAAMAAAYWLLSGDGIRRALEAQTTTAVGAPVHIGSATAVFFPRFAIRLTAVRVGDPARLSLGVVDLSAPVRALLHRRIEDADVVVSNSRLDMPLPFAMPATTSGGATRDAAAPIQLVSVRSIALRDVTLVSRGRAISLTADASLRGAELTVSRLTASSGATSLQAGGIVTLAPRVDARMRVTAGQLDLDELLALANAFSPPSTASGGTTGPPVRIAARISAATVKIGAITGRNFAGELQVEGDNVTLAPLGVQLFGGRYEGALSAQLGRAVSATLRSRVTGVDVAQLAAFGGVPGSISGTLSGAGTFSGSGADISAVLRAARGTGTASIVGGTIQHLDLVRTVVEFFGRRAADAPAASDRFDRLDVRFSLADQVLRADALALHAPDADLVGHGTLTLPTTVLDGRVDISLSAALSRQAGTDVARFTREGDRVVLPATIGGTLGSPHIGIDAAAAVKRGLRNEIEQRLGDLLERFRGQPQ